MIAGIGVINNLRPQLGVLPPEVLFGLNGSHVAAFAPSATGGEPAQSSITFQSNGNIVSPAGGTHVNASYFGSPQWATGTPSSPVFLKVVVTSEGDFGNPGSALNSHPENTWVDASFNRTWGCVGSAFQTYFYNFDLYGAVDNIGTGETLLGSFITEIGSSL